MRPWNQILLILTLGLSGLSAQEASEPVASFERGFYTAPFDVELSAATTGATIYYTTDGSTPSATNGTAYTAPVTISTTTPLRAITTAPALFDSEVMTHTYIFIADVLTQPNDPAGYPDTFAATDENGPYPADYEMDPEIVDHPRYAGNVDDALTAIGTVSIVTDIPNLFDPVTGIYYNPNEKGRIWERQINVEWIDPTGCGVEVTAHAGIRLHGQASRRPKRMPKKNMRLYFRGEYGTEDLDLNLFENRGEVWPPISSFDRIILMIYDFLLFHNGN